MIYLTRIIGFNILKVIYLRDEINGLFIREGFYVKIGGVSKDVFENFVEEVFVFHLKVAHDVSEEIFIDFVVQIVKITWHTFA